MKMLLTLICVSLYSLAVQAQLAVTVTPPKVVGQKAIVLLAMTNNLTEQVESARAVCFLLDEKGKMIGQSSKWVIGGINDRLALPSQSGTTYNFVITSPHAWATTNLTAKISFSRVVLDGGKLANVNQSVSVTAADK